MRITVIVPTYRRPADLSRCLAALRGQTRPPEEVLVSVRIDDNESHSVISGTRSGWPALHDVTVNRPGVVAAMNAALDAATGDMLALTDDDAAPEPDWLERMAATLESRPDVGGVGGRDVQAGINETRGDVGRVQWSGRVIGNHHVGIGPPREVDVLKGVCCAFRTSLVRPIRFDERLHGNGAQVHWELALCLALRRAGWRLIYDPAIRVLHHVAPRHDADQLHRGRFAVAPHEDAVYNETLILAEHFSPMRGLVFRTWSMLVGTGAEPGLLQLPRVLAKQGATGWHRFLATQRARRVAFTGTASNRVRSERP